MWESRQQAETWYDKATRYRENADLVVRLKRAKQALQEHDGWRQHDVEAINDAIAALTR